MKSLDLDRLDFLEYMFEGSLRIPVTAEDKGAFKTEEFSFDDVSMMVNQEKHEIWIEPIYWGDTPHEKSLKRYLDEELEDWVYRFKKSNPDIKATYVKCPTKDLVTYLEQLQEAIAPDHIKDFLDSLEGFNLEFSNLEHEVDQILGAVRSVLYERRDNQ